MPPEKDYAQATLNKAQDKFKKAYPDEELDDRLWAVVKDD